MRLAVVGAGSTYTPELVAGLARERDRLGLERVALHDIDRERRDVVGAMARRMLDHAGYGGALDITDDLDAAVDGADFVLVQIRVGGQAARHLDETIPLRCGCVGQETTGAGGFAKAMRTVPVMLEIAERVRERAAPDAWIVDFTNPVGIVTRALLDHGHRACGLCNVAIGIQRWIAARLGVAPERVAIGQVGLNHLTWVRSVEVDGEDMLDAAAGRAARRHRRRDRPAGAADPRPRRDPLLLPAVLLPATTRWSRSCAGGPRGPSRCRRSRRACSSSTATRPWSTKPALLEQRGGAFYSEAATQLVAGAGDRRRLGAGGRRRATRGAIRASPTTTWSSCRRGSAADGPEPLPQAPLDPDLLGLVQHVAAYERLAGGRGGARTRRWRAGARCSPTR